MDPEPDAPKPALGSSLLAAAQDQLLRASEQLGWPGGRRHKGIHQARKSIRRTRSVLALVDPVLGPGAAALDHSLSRINASLSVARDAQAVVEAIDHIGAQTDDDHWLQVLARARRRAVVARRLVLRATLAADPDLSGIRSLLAQVGTALAGLDWRQVSLEGVEAAFRASRDATGKAARKARKRGDDEAWHRWRRKARRQSQQHRILAEAQVDSTVKFDDKDIAELLGQQQDCSLLLGFCASDASPFRWPDRARLKGYVQKRLARLRKRLRRQSVRG